MKKEYIIYYGTILLASILAGISQKYSKKENNKIVSLNKFFWYSSMLIFVILIGFRKCGVGVDDGAYLGIFNSVKINGVINEFLSTTMEPGYLIINYLISLITDNFQMVIVITSVIPLFLYYKALEYEKNNVNLFLATFVLGTMLLLYFVGITRLFISASIIAYGYRYIIEGKKRKYFMCVSIASLFHYSAIIMVFLLFFSNKKKKSIVKVFWLMCIFVLIAIIVVNTYIFPNMGERYQSLKEGSNKLSIMTFDKFPILLLSVILSKDIKKYNKRIEMYNIIYLFSTVVSIYNGLFRIGRMEWYSNYCICIILPYIVRNIKKRGHGEFNIAVIGGIIVYAVLYSYKIVFLSVSNIGMQNYINVLF